MNKLTLTKEQNEAAKALYREVINDNSLGYDILNLPFNEFKELLFKEIGNEFINMLDDIAETKTKYKKMLN